MRLSVSSGRSFRGGFRGYPTWHVCRGRTGSAAGDRSIGPGERVAVLRRRVHVVHTAGLATQDTPQAARFPHGCAAGTGCCERAPGAAGKAVGRGAISAAGRPAVGRSRRDRGGRSAGLVGVARRRTRPGAGGDGPAETALSRGSGPEILLGDSRSCVTVIAMRCEHQSLVDCVTLSKTPLKPLLYFLV